MLTPGDHTRTLTVDGRERSYLVHVPGRNTTARRPRPSSSPSRRAMNGSTMARFCGLNKRPTGRASSSFTPTARARWVPAHLERGRYAIEGGPRRRGLHRKLLDDLGEVANVDPRRVYATGMSNGGMMCYRLGRRAFRPHRRHCPCRRNDGSRRLPSQAARARPALPRHATTLVPFAGGQGTPKFIRLHPSKTRSAPGSKSTAAPSQARGDRFSPPGRRHAGSAEDLRAGKNGSEAVLVVIQGGGHTWPGKTARCFPWKVHENHLGQRPDLGVLPEASDASRLWPEITSCHPERSEGSRTSQ